MAAMATGRGESAPNAFHSSNSKAPDSGAITCGHGMDKTDSDFAEWVHKVRFFVGGRFGQEILDAMSWAKTPRTPIVQNTGDDRFIGHSNVCGGADDIDRIPRLGTRKLRSLYAYLTSFMSGDANRVVRNICDSQGLVALRRLHSENDPLSSIRRVTILGCVQNPPTSDRLERLSCMCS